MTIQEFFAKYNSAAISDETADMLDTVLRRCLRKEEVESLERQRDDMMAEISLLNVKRNQLRQTRTDAEKSLQQKRQWFAELETLRKEVADLPEVLAKLEKEKARLKAAATESKKKYEETKRLMAALPKDRWLDPKIADTIKKIWNALPQDDLVLDNDSQTTTL